MSRLLALLALCAALIGTPVPASAQSLSILSGGCGSASYVNGTPYLTVDPYGHLCANIGPSPSQTITGNAVGTTGAVVGTLAGVAGKTTFICGVDISAIGGTAAVGPITIAGLTGSSMVYQLASAASGVTLSRTFTPCIPASAVNTAITTTTTADGSASAVSVNSWGYQQ